MAVVGALRASCFMCLQFRNNDETLSTNPGSDVFMIEVDDPSGRQQYHQTVMPMPLGPIGSAAARHD